MPKTTNKHPITGTPAEVADYLHTTPAALAQLRHRGQGPRFIRVGARKVIYRWSDVEAYLDANTMTRTDGPDAA